MKGPFLNSDQAAAYCGFTGGGQVMRNFKHLGTGPHVEKSGRRLLYKPEDLDLWIKSRQEETPGAAGVQDERN